MSETAIVKAELAPVAQAWNREQIELVKRTVCKGASDDELLLFQHVAERSGLDPFARQIHAVKRWDSKAQRETMTIQTGIDGFRLIADRTGQYAGSDDAVFDSEDGAHPNKAMVVVYKMIGGQRAAFGASARWAEYVACKKGGEPNQFWTKMPYLMLAKCAEALALRKAFPAELSGLYTREEMGQADNTEVPAPQAPSTQPTLPIPPPVVEKTRQQCMAHIHAALKDDLNGPIDWERFKGWMASVGRASEVDGRLTSSTATDEQIRDLSERLPFAVKKYRKWAGAATLKDELEAKFNKSVPAAPDESVATDPAVLKDECIGILQGMGPDAQAIALDQFGIPPAHAEKIIPTLSPGVARRLHAALTGGGA